MSDLLIVTDLDGTLLDHHSYSFAPAEPALEEIARRQIPLIFASSKTRVEMLALQEELGLTAPFICENGAAICEPDGTVEALVPPRDTVLASLHALREEKDFRFTGFADCSVEQVADMTGLTLEAAARAASREYSEPLLWEDEDERKAEFLALLAEHQLRGLQGGRFLSVAGQTDKGRALNCLRDRYGASITVIALGDSPNDEDMLAAADIAVIIRSERSEAIQPAGPRRIVRTEQPGPQGWHEAMMPLLTEYQ